MTNRSLALLLLAGTPAFAEESLPTRPWAPDVDIETRVFEHERAAIRKRNVRVAAIGTGGTVVVGILAAAIASNSRPAPSSGWQIRIRFPAAAEATFGSALGIAPGLALGSILYLAIPEPTNKASAEHRGNAMFWSGTATAAAGLGTVIYGGHLLGKEFEASTGSIASVVGGGTLMGIGMSLMINGGNEKLLATRVLPWSSTTGAGMTVSGSF